MKFFTFTKLERAVLMLAVLVIGAVCWLGCGDDSGANSGGGGGGGSGSYESVTIGGKKWMKKNLDIKTEESWCYGEGGQERIYRDDDDDNPILRTLSSSEVQSNCNKYGRLYTWAAAKKACPKGWRIPLLADWDALVEAVGGRKRIESDNGGYDEVHGWIDWYDAGKKLKSTSGWNTYVDDEGVMYGNGTDNYGFTGLPGGGRAASGYFVGAGLHGAWWGDVTDMVGDTRGWWVTLSYDWDHISSDASGQKHAFSVRCIAD